MMKATFAIAAATIVTFATATASAQGSNASSGSLAALSALSGRYTSAGAEDWGRGTYGRREFTFDHGHWTLRFTLALDPAFSHPVFEFRTKGSYRVLGPSAAVPGAFEADFREEAKLVTLLTDDQKLVEGFGLAACGLHTGVEKDVSVVGCAGWKPVSICPEDHDLLALDESGGLHFGVRPSDNDMCTADKRPTALLTAVHKD